MLDTFFNGLLVLQVIFLLPWLIAWMVKASRERVPRNRMKEGKISFARQTGRNIQFGILEPLPDGGGEMTATYSFPAPAPGIMPGAYAKLCVHNDICYAYDAGDGIVRNSASMLSIMGLRSRLIVIPLAGIPGSLYLAAYRTIGARGVLPKWIMFWVIFNIVCLVVYEFIMRSEQAALDAMTTRLTESETKKAEPDAVTASENNGMPG